MSDSPGGPGWWMADDQNWYPPGDRNGTSTAPPQPEPATEVGTDAVRSPDPNDAPTVASTRVAPDANTAWEPVPPPDEPGSGGALRAMLIAAAVAVVLVAAIGGYLLGGTSDEGEPIAADDTTTTSEPTTTAPPEAIEPDLEPEPTTPDPPPDTPAVLDEPAGLFCMDLNAKGYNYNEAVDYWEHHGRPSNMDASGNGIPCQTVYPASQVEARWGASATESTCPTSAEVRTGAEQMGFGGSLEFGAVSCVDGWATAEVYGPEYAEIYFEQLDGRWVARDWASGHGAETLCHQVVRSARARDSLCFPL